MQINRTFEILVATKRRYVIRQSPSGKQIPCSDCGEPMVTTEQAASWFGIKQRRIFEIIETRAAHFTEIKSGAVMICVSSLAIVLEGGVEKKEFTVKCYGGAINRLSRRFWSLSLIKVLNNKVVKQFNYLVNQEKKMKMKFGQIFMIAIVGLIGVTSANSQEHMNSFQIVSNVLANGQSIKQGQGLRSPNGKYAVVLQKDGNLCLYKIDPKAKYGNQFIKCSMTVGSEDKKGSVLKMQSDGNLALYNAKGDHLWSTDTYRGDATKRGWRLIMGDDGRLILVNKAEEDVYNFQTGRLY